MWSSINYQIISVKWLYKDNIIKLFTSVNAPYMAVRICNIICCSCWWIEYLFDDIVGNEDVNLAIIPNLSRCYTFRQISVQITDRRFEILRYSHTNDRPLTQRYIRVHLYNTRDTFQLYLQFETFLILCDILFDPYIQIPAVRV